MFLVSWKLGVAATTMAEGVNGVEREPTKEEIVQLREKHHFSSNEIFFKEDPLQITKGEGVFLIADNGDKYLDCINNVSHVGHCNARVVEAICRQAGQLNTNNRYLHPILPRLAKRLVDTFATNSDGRNLARVAFVNSGSEANDLALRLARKYTGSDDVITLDRAYHGHVTSTIEISPYKSKDLEVNSDVVHQVACPDIYRGKFTEGRPDELAELYAREVEEVIERLKKKNRRPIFIAESLQSCGGQIIPPPGYLRRVFDAVHAAGGVCIADEVQVGFGRVGSHWWAFQAQGEDIHPDIVTIGKPMGNGHPVAAVIFTEEINTAFKNGVAYFNTYGGNPVSCAAAMAVMDEIQHKDLMKHCSKIGNLLKTKLEELKRRHKLIGDVRVLGMFAGLDLVKDRVTREPATDEAQRLLRAMLMERVLLSADGPHRNVIKFKPPIVFNEANVDELVTKLDRVLTKLESPQSRL